MLQCVNGSVLNLFLSIAISHSAHHKLSEFGLFLLMIMKLRLNLNHLTWHLDLELVKPL